MRTRKKTFYHIFLGMFLGGSNSQSYPPNYPNKMICLKMEGGRKKTVEPPPSTRSSPTTFSCHCSSTLFSCNGQPLWFSYVQKSLSSNISRIPLNITGGSFHFLSLICSPLVDNFNVDVNSMSSYSAYSNESEDDCIGR